MSLTASVLEEKKLSTSPATIPNSVSRSHSLPVTSWSPLCPNEPVYLFPLLAVGQRTMEGGDHWLAFSFEKFSSQRINLKSCLGPQSPGIDQLKMFMGVEAGTACLLSSRITKKVNRQKETTMMQKTRYQ